MIIIELFLKSAGLERAKEGETSLAGGNRAVKPQALAANLANRDRPDRGKEVDLLVPTNIKCPIFSPVCGLDLPKPFILED